MYKNKGMFFEELINRTINFYKNNNVAIFHKKNIDIKFASIDKKTNKIKSGWIKNKSTVDYYGIYKGRFVAFEAKSTNLSYLPISNIKKHQIKYMNDIERHGGISFLFIYFNLNNKIFMIKNKYLKKIQNKKITFDFVIKNGKKIDIVFPGIIDFIKKI